MSAVYAPFLLAFAHDVVRLAPLRVLDMTLASLVRWDSVLLVQRFRSPAADAWFTHFPLLGNEVQYALGIPLLAWYAHGAAVVGLGLAFGWRGTWLRFGSGSGSG